jgi:peptidoglycan/xylan/chitin deacetylase (PgdA/CDA1 family)
MVGALASLVVVAAGVTFAGLQSMLPRSQFYGASFNAAPGSRRLSLTYDDGPNDASTLPLLEVLAKYQVRATFFLLGRYVEARPQLAHAVADAGHVIGNHGYSHRNLIFLSANETRRELTRASQAIETATGVWPVLFRPPFGGRRPGTFTIARECGMTPIMWRVSGNDWKAGSAESIAQRVCSAVKGGEVILLHDGGHQAQGTDRSLTVRATDEVIRRCQGEGYQFVTVPEMMQVLSPGN